MKPTIQYICGCLILVLSTSFLSAQNIPLTVNPEMFVDESISSSEVSEVSKAAERIVNEYARRAHLTNEKGKVTRLAGNDFKAMFKATARIFADYLQFPGGIGDDVAAYRQTVMEKFPENGLPFIIRNAELMSVRGEGYRFYIVELRFSKSIRAYIDGKGRIRDAAEDGSRNFILKMTAEISTEDLSKFKIRDIACDGKCGKPAADRIRYLSAVGTFAVPITTATKREVQGVASDMNSYSFVQELRASAGLRFTSNFLAAPGASGKNLFFTAGLDVGLSRFSGNLQDYSLDPIPDERLDAATIGGEVASYQRLVSDVFLTEKVSMLTLEAPIGVAYRLIDNYDKVFMLEATLRPSIALSSTVNWARGSGRFDGAIPDAKFVVLDNSHYRGTPNPASNPFNACECSRLSRDESSELDTGLGLYFQLSPTFYSNLDNGDPALGFQLSLDFGFNLISPITATNSGTPILQDPSGETGILSNEYFDTRLHYIGFRAGVFLQKVSPVNIR